MSEWQDKPDGDGFYERLTPHYHDIVQVFRGVYYDYLGRGNISDHRAAKWKRIHLSKPPITLPDKPTPFRAKHTSGRVVGVFIPGCGFQIWGESGSYCQLQTGNTLTDIEFWQCE